MIVSEKHSIIILNPPKTGTWFRKKLLFKYNRKCKMRFERKGLKHQSLKQLAEGASSVLNKNLESYKILTFCRNPWERAASWLQMLKKYRNEEHNMNEVFRLLNAGKQEYYCSYGSLKADFIIECYEQEQKIYEIFRDFGLTLEVGHPELYEQMSNKYDDPIKKLEKYKKIFENTCDVDKIRELEEYIIDLKGYTFDL